MAMSDKPDLWRRDAAVLRRYGQVSLAEVLETLAEELETATHSKSEEVGLDKAVHLSGYSAAHLRRLVREQKLRNLGTSKKPKFLTSDLPRKPGYTPESKRVETDFAQPHISTYQQVARAVVRGG